MKRIVLLIMLIVSNLTLTYAQDSIVRYIADHPQSMNLCVDYHQTVVIYAEQNCEQWYWEIDNAIHNMENPIIIESQTPHSFHIQYYGCNVAHSFYVRYKESHVPNSYTQVKWKQQAESDSLAAVGHDSIDYPFQYQYQWSTGETTRVIEVTEPGTYTCQISELCGTATRTFIVRDNVEIELATCDLESNLNMVTWSTTSEQAQYIDHIIVKRDGMQVGTAPYSDGQFTDNIGSGSASRTYTLTAIVTDGTECPIVSYPKETIHMSYTLGMNNTIEIEWNTPTGYDLLGYNICEWHEDDGSLSVIDFVGASVTSYTCSESQFDQGYIVVQGVEAGKDGETRLLSNRSLDIIVGLGENEATAFRVYPNPANGILFVETCHGASLQMETYRIVNPIGQTVMEGQITTEKQQISVRDLPNGVYFITVDGETRKFVVE